MEQEEKQLLLKDLCARLPYRVKVQFSLPNYNTNCFDDKIGEVFEIGNVFTHVHCDGIDYLLNTNRIKPYLRSMSSMTEEEENEYFGRTMTIDIVETSRQVIDWLLKHHFDYRGLISMGLALEAPVDMYKTE